MCAKMDPQSQFDPFQLDSVYWNLRENTLMLWLFVSRIKAQEVNALMLRFAHRALHISGAFFPRAVCLGLNGLQQPRGTQIPSHLGCQTISQQGSEEVFT